MTDTENNMLCSKCDKHYVGKGYYCWSGNKRSVPHCNNGNPDKDRILYKSGDNSPTVTTERKLIERGGINA